MKTYIAAYLSAAVCMLVLDTIWLSMMASRLYRPLIGELMLDGFRLAPAVAFYFLYLSGVLLLAVVPALEAEKWTIAAMNGLVLGLVAYGTYDLTNQATLKVWPPVVTFVDLAWGAFLTVSTALAGYAGGTYMRG
ncbi:MAG: DUF2177 family protein [Beijerinckiaceae bacterium]